MPSLTDNILTYNFIRRFVTPYEEWPAFKSGVIDNEGNIKVKRKELTSDQDKSFGNYDRLILNLRKLLAKLPVGRSRLGLWAATALLLKEGETLDPDNVDLLKEKLDSQLLKVKDSYLSEGIRFRSAFANYEPEEGTGVPHKVDAWHQSRANGWCVQVLDKHGNQVGDAEYHYRKPDAMRARKQLMKHHNLKEDAVAANAVGGGNIAGTTEAGDDPPVRKKAASKYARKNKKFSDMAFARRAGVKNV